MRALEFCKIMNEHPEEYELSKPLDPLVVGTAAMAHDLGNVIYRDGHNHLGYAIIKGEFNLQDFLDVPVKNGETKEYLDDISKQEFIEAVETNGYYFSKKDIEHFPVALEYLTTQIVFNLAYNENDVKTENDLRKYINDNFENVSKDLVDAVVKEMIAKNGFIKITYHPELQELTQSFNNVFEKGSIELKIISEAVQDHNIDYKNKIEHNQSRSPEGMIVYDADKDNNPYVFLARTVQFAIHKIAMTDRKEFCLKKNPTAEEIEQYGNYVPDILQCCKHVLHQSWERFRESAEEYVIRTGRPANKREFWNDIAEYKHGLNKVKGVVENNSIPCPKTQQEKDAAVAGYNYVVDSKHNLITFLISPNEGEDLYSQIDNHSTSHRIRDFKSRFINKVRDWADPRKEKESLKEINKIAKQLIKAENKSEFISRTEFCGFDKSYFGSFDKYNIKNIFKLFMQEAEKYKNENSLDFKLKKHTEEYREEKRKSNNTKKSQTMNNETMDKR